MRNARYRTRIVALMLALMLVLGLMPALAAKAEPAIDEENLLSALEAANTPEQRYQRHTTMHNHLNEYVGGELYVSSELYATAESVYFFFGEDEIDYVTPTCYFSYLTDGSFYALPSTPEESAETMAYYQTIITMPEEEVLEACEERDGELFIATRTTDADVIRERFEQRVASYGDEAVNEYVDGMEIVTLYRADAADLSLKELSEKQILPDGSERPFTENTFVYDEAIADPAAPDSVMAPLFDDTVEKWQLNVVFGPGTPEEQTCQYTLPKGILIAIQYHGENVQAYEDAACTQIAEGGKGAKEYTVYVKGAAE